MRRIITQTLRQTGAPVAAATVNYWAAPFPCTVVGVRALRTGGANAVVQVKAGGTNVLSSNLTAGNDTFAAAPAANISAAAADMDAGELLAVQVVSGDATALSVQVELAVDATADGELL